MKKLVIALAAFSSLMVLSCRQQEEMMDSEDIKSLSVLQEAKSKASDLKQSRKVSDSIILKTTSTNSLEIDAGKPPRN